MYQNKQNNYKQGYNTMTLEAIRTAEPDATLGQGSVDAEFTRITTGIEPAVQHVSQNERTTGLAPLVTKDGLSHPTFLAEPKQPEQPRTRKERVAAERRAEADGSEGIDIIGRELDIEADAFTPNASGHFGRHAEINPADKFEGIYASLGVSRENIDKVRANAKDEAARTTQEELDGRTKFAAIYHDLGAMPEQIAKARLNAQVKASTDGAEPAPAVAAKAQEIIDSIVAKGKEIEDEIVGIPTSEISRPTDPEALEVTGEIPVLTEELLAALDANAKPTEEPQAAPDTVSEPGKGSTVPEVVDATPVAEQSASEQTGAVVPEVTAGQGKRQVRAVRLVGRAAVRTMLQRIRRQKPVTPTHTISAQSR
jgi:hypothetical protein